MPETREQSLRKERGIAQSHLDDLKAHRLQITKAHLARDYETAFDAALYSLCMGVIRVGHFAKPLDLRANPTRPKSSLNDLGGTAAEVQLKAMQDGLALSWTSLPPAEAFAAMCSLSAEEKQALIAWCVAQSLEGQLSIEDRANPVIQRLGIDFANYWRPTADNYWSRVKKDHALDVGAEILGKQWRRDFSKANKAEFAKVLERAFDSETSAGMALDEEARARAAKWVPAGFDFELDVGQAEQTGTGASAEEPGTTDAGADIDPAADDRDSTALPEFLTGSESRPAAADLGGGRAAVGAAKTLWAATTTSPPPPSLANWRRSPGASRISSAAAHRNPSIRPRPFIHGRGFHFHTSDHGELPCRTP